MIEIGLELRLSSSSIFATTNLAIGDFLEVKSWDSTWAECVSSHQKKIVDADVKRVQLAWQMKHLQLNVHSRNREPNKQRRNNLQR